MASREPDLAELYRRRLAEVSAAAADAGLDAVLLTPGPDLRYVTGYDAHQLERLTCLVVPATGDPVCWSRGWSSPPRTLPRPAASASRSRPGTRPTTRTRWSRPGSGSAAGWACRTGCGRSWCCGCGPRCPRPSRCWPALRYATCGRARARRRWRRCWRRARRSTGCTRRCRAGCGQAAPRNRSPPTSATPSSRPGTRGSTSRSSVPGRTAPARTTRPRAGCCSPATWWWSTSAAPCRAATARTAPAPT